MGQISMKIICLPGSLLSANQHAIIAGIKGADPSMTLQAICTRLEDMRERTPRGRSKWEPSSVKMLLARAERLGLLEKAAAETD